MLGIDMLIVNILVHICVSIQFRWILLKLKDQNFYWPDDPDKQGHETKANKNLQNIYSNHLSSSVAIQTVS